MPMISNGLKCPEVGPCIGRCQVNFLRGQASELEDEEGVGMWHHSGLPLDVVPANEPGHRAASHFQDSEKDTEVCRSKAVTLWLLFPGIPGVTISTPAISQGIPFLIIASSPCPHVRRLLRAWVVAADTLEFEFPLCYLLKGGFAHA